MSEFINRIKDGYVAVLDWIEDHPQSALWSAVAIVIVLAVF
jgi:hypothetical protein